MAQATRFTVFIGTEKPMGDHPPACWLTDFPPLEGETSNQYRRRVTVETVLAFYAEQDRTERKWWQFWRPSKLEAR